MTSRDLVTELLCRIRADIEHFGGALPERTAIAWRGYLAAMLEWGLLPVAQYDALAARLPSVRDDPAVSILLGRETSPGTDADEASQSMPSSAASR